MHTLTNDALITVAIPVYNQLGFLEEAILSVVEQTYSNLEILIIDDGSQPSVEQYLSAKKALVIGDPRLKFLRTDQNRGIATALNLGIECARGELFARLDSDDIAYPSRLEAQVACFQENADLVLLGTGANYIDEHQREFLYAPAPSGNHHLQELLPKANPFNHPSVMMRLDTLRQIKGYRGGHRAIFGPREGAEDYDLWLGIAEVGEIDNISAPLIRYRVHKNQTSILNLIRTRVAHDVYAELARQRRNDGAEDLVAALAVVQKNLADTLTACEEDLAWWNTVYKKSGFSTSPETISAYESELLRLKQSHSRGELFLAEIVSFA